MTKYSLETRLEAVQAYLDGVESYKDIAQKYRFSCLTFWVQIKIEVLTVYTNLRWVYHIVEPFTLLL